MKILLSLSFLFLFGKIQLFAQKPKEVVHFNLVFAPDLSNRLNSKLYPKPLNDAEIVEGVLKKVWPEILMIKRSEGQMDQYTVDFINKGLIQIYKVNTAALSIDFRRFENHQNERINYIKARDKTTRTLPQDINKFITEYKLFNSKAAVNNNGADIWTYFQSGLDNRIVLPDVRMGKVTHKFRNILVLLTDGYIEAGIYGKGFDLSATKVIAFRDAFLKSKSSSMESFLFKNPRFKIAPTRNLFLNNLEVIVMEMYDRSLSIAGSATKHPTDMEIMKVIWADWLKSSGVKRFDLKSVAINKDTAVSYIMDFIKK